MNNIRMFRQVDEFLQRITTNLTVTYCLIIGTVLIITSFTPLLSSSETGKSILIGIGGSLVATSIAVFITSRYQLRYARVKDITESWGLYGIYKSRQAMNHDSNIELEYMEKNLDFIAWGLSSFISLHDDLVRAKVKAGLQIRILSPNPESPYVIQRAIEEKSSEDQIKKNIESLHEWVKQLQTIAPDSNNVAIRFYDTLPQSHYMRIDTNVYTGPYLHEILSQQTISFSFKYGEMFTFYTKYFDKLWNNPTFCHD